MNTQTTTVKTIQQEIDIIQPRRDALKNEQDKAVREIYSRFAPLLNEVDNKILNLKYTVRVYTRRFVSMPQWDGETFLLVSKEIEERWIHRGRPHDGWWHPAAQGYIRVGYGAELPDPVKGTGDWELKTEIQFDVCSIDSLW